MQGRTVLRHFFHSRPHLSVAVLVGVALGLLLPESLDWLRRALLAWNAAVWFYLLTIAPVLMRADCTSVRATAAKQDENAGVVLLALILASVLSFSAVIIELGHASSAGPQPPTLHYALTAATVFGSWFLVGTLFCIHYAHLYYRAAPTARPLLFTPPEQQPDYWDFLYFSFTIAVAAQTSDVCVRSRAMRKLVLAQSVLSFFFNLAILGLSVNIGASLINLS
jgi:uncharacterized membrane protein